jgi:hypothetical protein
LVLTIASSARGATRRLRKRVSVWWDIGGPATIRYLDRHLNNLKTLGVSGVVVMLDEPDGTTSFAVDDLANFASVLRKSGIALGIDVWPHPTQEFVSDRLPWLISVVRSVGAQFVEFDAEGNWTDGKARGYASLDDAAWYVAKTMRSCPVPWGITTFRERLAGSAYTLGKFGSFVVPQAYSWVGNTDVIGASPGFYQTEVFKQSQQFYGRMPIIMGLAAYGQEFPGMNPADAMLVAARTAFGFVDEVRFWSWKWIGGLDGTPKNRYAFDALQQIRREIG